MRSLAPPPRVIVDPETRRIAVGSYRGDLPRVDLSPLAAGPIFAFTHEKRWVFATIAVGEVLLGFLVIHLGYVANHFVFAFDREQGRMLVDSSSLTLPMFCEIGDQAGEGCSAHYEQPLAQSMARVHRPIGSSDYLIEVRGPKLSVDATLSTIGAPPPIAAVARVGADVDGLVQVTEKYALLSARGAATIDGKRVSLDGGLAGIDYSHGRLPRRTSWKWAFALGRAKTGERVAVNLTQGFVGEAECAVWIENDLFAVGEGRIEFDATRPLDPWIVRSADGAVDLRFEPGAVHAEHRDLIIVSSDYVQPAGSFSGSIEVEGRGKIEIDRVLGVVEDQRALW